MTRLLFEKTGNAVWISHLDLMRLFRRAFKRVGLDLKHTQGFSPRPSVSIALPLSVGVESHCELLDFELVGAPVSHEHVMTALNEALVEGVRVLAVYEAGRKIKDLSLLDCVVTLEYDAGIPADAQEGIEKLFARGCLTVEKKGKNGIVEQDIIPMIRSIDINRADENTLELCCRICCQNPSLNPAQLTAAIGRYAPQWLPDFSKCCRIEIYGSDETIFR